VTRQTKQALIGTMVAIGWPVMVIAFVKWISG
jgi:hypothetical protein